jgi:hypothetical protein
MRFKALLQIEGNTKENYSSSKHDIKIGVKDSALLIDTGTFYCRDELLDCLSYSFNKFYKKNPEAKIIAFGPKTNLVFSNPKHRKGHSYIQQGILGNTNKTFNLLASPYLLRWYIGAVRSYRASSPLAALAGKANKPSLQDIHKAFRHKDFFYKTMTEADSREVSLEKDFFKAWQLNLFEAPRYESYGHMGLVNLKWMSQPFASTLKLNYKEAFPPSQFIKVPKK